MSGAQAPAADGRLPGADGRAGREQGAGDRLRARGAPTDRFSPELERTLLLALAGGDPAELAAAASALLEARAAGRAAGATDCRECGAVHTPAERCPAVPDERRQAVRP